eukprot:COSAG02_NODE_42099_length_388_cov_0.477509_1_plen_28_part_10
MQNAVQNAVQLVKIDRKTRRFMNIGAGK